VAELLQLRNQPSGVGFVVASLVPVGTEIVVGLVTFEHPVRRNQDRMRNRDLGSAAAAAPHHSGVLGSEIVPAVHPTEPAASTSIAHSHRFPCRVPAGVRRPADSCMAGASPAQEVRCPASGTETCRRRFRRRSPV
jgi:hypothetical protein